MSLRTQSEHWSVLVRLGIVTLVFLLGAGRATAEAETDVADAGSTDVVLSLDESPRAVTSAALAAAQQSICAVVYKFDDARLLAPLVDAVRRGVRVQVLLDRKEALKAGSQAAQLAAAGAQLRVWPRSRSKLHAKLVIIDGRTLLTGSYNWTRSGADKNVELLLRSDDRTIVGRCREIFAGLWDQGLPMPDDR